LADSVYVYSLQHYIINLFNTFASLVLLSRYTCCYPCH